MINTQIMKMILLIFFFPTFIFSQQINNNKISSNVWILANQHTNSYKEVYENGEKMLSISVSNEDRAKSFGHMADAKIKLLEYDDAIKLLDKASYYAKKSNFDSESLMIYYLRSYVYKKINLEKQSNEDWDKVVMLTEKLKYPNFKRMVNEREAIKLEDKSDYYNAMKYRLQITRINEELVKENKNITRDQSVIHSIDYNYLAFNYLKSNKLDSAKIAMKKADIILKNLVQKRDYLIGLHYLCNAMINDHEKNYRKSEFWFNKALLKAQAEKTDHLLEKITREILSSNVYKSNFNENDKNLNTYIKIKEKTQLQISKYAERKIDERNLKIEKQNFTIYIWTVITLILIASIISLSIYFEKRKKKQETEFQKIIKKLKTASQNHPLLVPLEISKKRPTSISVKKENEILEKLLQFEAGEEFNGEKFTLDKLSSILGTNSSYTSQIVKKHRSKSFNDYINSLKINYIVDKLYSDIKYRQYKISVLSKMLGFSSQSKFASAFKAEFEIPPSVFIARLIEETNTKKCVHSVSSLRSNDL